MRGVSLLLATLLLAAACSSPDKPSGSTTTSGVPASATPVHSVPATSAATRTPAPVITASREPASTCGSTSRWSTATVSDATMAVAELYNVRAAAHTCYDRIVFDINGPERAGYHAEYVDTVTSDGQGAPVPVAGKAALQFTVRAWSFAHAGHQPGRKPWRTGKELKGRVGKSVAQVKFAGEHEGQCTFAIGVSSKKPFQVSTWRQGAVMHVILDIAH
ncbi:MAG TPA: hypothetical protein VLA88_05730 [Candidatus Saccharimonadales bacterium]|nr:hypothetical protein [Candidatus Saccharimonadales bacterium]